MNISLKLWGCLFSGVTVAHVLKFHLWNLTRILLKDWSKDVLSKLIANATGKCAMSTSCGPDLAHVLELLFFLRVLELIHEAKWLTRLGIQIPDTAHHIMVQEARFKSYNDHLQLCITEFKQVSLAYSQCIKQWWFVVAILASSSLQSVTSNHVVRTRQFRLDDAKISEKFIQLCVWLWHIW